MEEGTHLNGPQPILLTAWTRILEKERQKNEVYQKKMKAPQNLIWTSLNRWDFLYILSVNDLALHD